MLTPYLDEFIAIALVNLLGLVLPGPDFAVVVRNSLSHSRSHGIMTALGISLGIGVHVLYTLLGVAVLIQSTPSIFFVIKLVGAAYLSYLGISSIISGKSKEKHQVTSEKAIERKRSLARSLLEGTFTNIFNPKCSVYFLCLFSATIDLKTPNLILALIAAEVILLTFLWFASLASLITIKSFKKKLESFFPMIEKLMGSFLIALSIYIVFFEKTH